MGATVVRPLTDVQRKRIEAKIRQIGDDIAYLIGAGGSGPVYAGSLLQDADFQRRRAELLQQVLDTNDVDEIVARAGRAFRQAEVESEPRKAEERRLEAALLLWAVEEE